MAPIVFAVEQPFSRPTVRKLPRPGLRGSLLVLATAAWLALYAGMGWRFWVRGVHLSNTLDLWLLIVSIVLGVIVIVGWAVAWRDWRRDRLAGRRPATRLPAGGELEPLPF